MTEAEVRDITARAVILETGPEADTGGEEAPEQQQQQKQEDREDR